MLPGVEIAPYNDVAALRATLDGSFAGLFNSNSASKKRQLAWNRCLHGLYNGRTVQSPIAGRCAPDW
jgi:hypothetical protein